MLWDLFIFQRGKRFLLGQTPGDSFPGIYARSVDKQAGFTLELLFDTLPRAAYNKRCEGGALNRRGTAVPDK